MCCCSFMLDCSGIRLEYARYQCLSRELLTAFLCYFPALTIGQEVGWYDHRSSHLTEHSAIVWTGLGEQSRASKRLLDTNASNLGQRQRWSLMTFLYLSVHILCQCLFKASVLTSNVLGALHWNSIYCVCLRRSTWSQKYADESSHDWQRRHAGYVSPCTLEFFLLTRGIQQSSRPSRWQMQWVFVWHCRGSYSTDCAPL
jgi:hypothetical protein